MLFEQIGTNGRSFAKDPCVVKLGGMYYMYYSTVVRDERFGDSRICDWHRGERRP